MKRAQRKPTYARYVNGPTLLQRSLRFICATTGIQVNHRNNMNLALHLYHKLRVCVPNVVLLSSGRKVVYTVITVDTVNAE